MQWCYVPTLASTLLSSLHFSLDLGWQKIQSPSLPSHQLRILKKQLKDLASTYEGPSASPKGIQWAEYANHKHTSKTSELHSASKNSSNHSWSTSLSAASHKDDDFVPFVGKTWARKGHEIRELKAIWFPVILCVEWNLTSNSIMSVLQLLQGHGLCKDIKERLFVLTYEWVSSRGGASYLPALQLWRELILFYSIEQSDHCKWNLQSEQMSSILKKQNSWHTHTSKRRPQKRDSTGTQQNYWRRTGSHLCRRLLHAVYGQEKHFAPSSRRSSSPETFQSWHQVIALDTGCDEIQE